MTAARASTGALKERIAKLESLLDTTKAMTVERDLDGLLRLILREAVRVVDADRCSLWIVDQARGELWTKIAQGMSDGATIRIPLGAGIAGEVAKTGESINIRDAYADPRFNPGVDKDTGYRTRTILAVPMRYTTGETKGVLQALNKRGKRFFTKEDEELLMAFGANAASAVENAILYDEIDRLFEGLVRASVVAIESRDPTTSGHSERVAELAMSLAENLHKSPAPPYAGLRFGISELRELRYAALLHDFGKVLVREGVLTKAEKLYPSELSVIAARFEVLAAQSESGAGKLRIDKEKLQRLLELVRRCNQPSLLDERDGSSLDELVGLYYVDQGGERVPVLSREELTRLAIPRGSLDGEERRELESHVTHTYEFLAQIPWTRGLQRVPEIAHAHHEKLNGKGYPRGLQGDEIPLQSRILAIADIYDALTASDRPYKRAVSHERAIAILRDEVREGCLDGALLEVFIEAEVHRCLAREGVKNPRCDP